MDDDVDRTIAAWSCSDAFVDPAGAIEAIYPLTPTQVGILGQTLGPDGAGAYLQQLDCALRGSLNPAAFRRAWQLVVARNAALRTLVIDRADGEPLQVVLARAALPWREADWRPLTAQQQEAAMARHLQADRSTGLRLASAPLARVFLARTGEDRWRLCWTVHHVVLDGQSSVAVLTEVLLAHRAYRLGRQPELAAPVGFVEHVSWLRGRNRRDAESFWRGELAGAPAPSRIPADAQPDPAVGEWRWGEEAIDLGARGAADLHAAARQARVPVNALAHAAWARLLQVYGARRELRYGLTVAVRSLDVPGAASAIGLLVNTVPVRTTVDDADTVADWARAATAKRAKLDEVAHVAAADIQAWAGLPPATPLFDTMLVFEDYPGRGRWRDVDPQLTVEQATFRGQTNLPLTLVVSLDGPGTVRAMYDRRRYRRETVQGLLGSFVTGAVAIAADPARPMGDVPLLAPGDAQRVEAGWNATTVGYPRDATIPEVFARAAAMAADRVAIRDGELAITYRELDRRSAILARRLRRHGVGVETRVGVWCRRAAHAVLAYLAVLRAGGCYLPLSAEDPAARLAGLLRHAGAPLCVTDGAVPAGGFGVPVLDLTAPQEGAGSGAAGPPPHRAERLAYAMSTSGSSGEPKLVAVTHRGVLRLVCGADYVQIAPSDVVAQASNLAFDASTFEIWGALLNGAELAVIDRAELLDPARLSTAVARLGVGILFVTTALFNQLVTEAPEVLGRLRCVLFGGERVEPEAVREAVRRHPPRLLRHVYGPTETTTFATWHPIADVPPQATNVPIGLPIANTTAYVVDGRLRPVPAGALGELVLGGDGLARGYLDSPAATAAAFVPDPFSPLPGARLYRTGDLVRRGPGGQLEFVGRRDTQIKLRGFRIELGEIEAALRRHPAVRHAVATVDGEAGFARLVAYAAVRDTATAPTGEALRTLLATHLPQHAVPAAVYVVDELPLNANGKVDRRRRKAPQEVSPTGFSTPRTALERTIASIWQEVLRRPRIGVAENFFDIGGNSLLLVNVVNRLRRSLDLDVDVIDLFSYPTIAALADHLSTLAAAPQEEVSAESVRERGDRRMAAINLRQQDHR